MSAIEVIQLKPGHADWPPLSKRRLGNAAPAALSVLGDTGLLAARKTALFCSARTPGDAILRAHDAAQRLRDDGVTVISGFHSPIEQDCLRILLRGKQPIIICPARAIETLRIPAACRTAFDAGRVLFLSPFFKQPVRVTKESAMRRNELVAALADEAYIAHIAAGGQTARVAEMLAGWKVPVEMGVFRTGA